MPDSSLRLGAAFLGGAVRSLSGCDIFSAPALSRDRTMPAAGQVAASPQLGHLIRLPPNSSLTESFLSHEGQVKVIMRSDHTAEEMPCLPFRQKSPRAGLRGRPVSRNAVGATLEISHGALRNLAR